MIRRRGEGGRASFTVRRISYGVGVERTFPLHSPRIERVEVCGAGRVRRSKLYYLRGLAGKAARLKEKRVSPPVERGRAPWPQAARPVQPTLVDPAEGPYP